jgi:NADPH-dependent curcumin reductase CurA
VGKPLEGGAVGEVVESRASGIDQAVGAFIGLFEGKNVGEMVVKLA